jgi:hypothetical protein
LTGYFWTHYFCAGFSAEIKKLLLFSAKIKKFISAARKPVKNNLLSTVATKY